VGEETFEENKKFMPDTFEAILVLTMIIGTGIGVLTTAIGAMSESLVVIYLGFIISFTCMVLLPLILFIYDKVIKKRKAKIQKRKREQKSNLERKF
jgi:large-conductance mechanosensitive channel